MGNILIVFLLLCDVCGNAKAYKIPCYESHQNNITIIPPDMVVWLYNEQIAENHWPAIYFDGIMMILGIIGNGFVIYAYGLKFRKTHANIFIIWLAICDMVCCTFYIPFEIFQLRFFIYPYKDAVTCKIFRVIGYAFYIAQVMTLLCIALDRYLKICKPLKIYSFHNPFYLMVSAISVAVMLSWPAAFIYGINTIYACIPGVYGKSCFFNDSVKDTIFPTLYLGSLYSVFMVAFLIIYILYVKIVQSIRKWKQNLNHGIKIHRSSSNHTSRDEYIQNVSIQNDKTVSSSHRQGICSIKKKCKSSDHECDGNEIRKYRECPNEMNETGFNHRDVFTRRSYSRQRNDGLGSQMLHENLQTTNSKQEYRHTESKFKNQARTAKSISIFTAVTVCFVISYIPFFTFAILGKANVIHMDTQSTVMKKIIQIARDSYCINNACNPIIYSIFNPEFRRVCLGLFSIKGSRSRLNTSGRITYV